MKAQYTDETKYSVKLSNGETIPRLFEYEWKLFGLDKLEAEGSISDYTPPTYVEPGPYVAPEE